MSKWLWFKFIFNLPIFIEKEPFVFACQQIFFYFPKKKNIIHSLVQMNFKNKKKVWTANNSLILLSSFNKWILEIWVMWLVFGGRCVYVVYIYEARCIICTCRSNWKFVSKQFQKLECRTKNFEFQHFRLNLFNFCFVLVLLHIIVHQSRIRFFFVEWTNRCRWRNYFWFRYVFC